MVVTKQELLRLVDGLPENIDVDELMHKLCLQSKLDQSEEAIRAGRTISHADLAVEVQQWRK